MSGRERCEEILRPIDDAPAWQAHAGLAGPVRFHPSLRTAAHLMADRAGEDDADVA